MELRIVGSDENIEEVTPDTNRIYEIRNFADDEGRMVVGKYPVDSPDTPSFAGSFMVGTNMGPVRLNMDFTEGYTIQDCFDNFDAMAQETLKNAQEEANERNRIVTPDQMKRGSGIIVP